MTLAAYNQPPSEVYRNINKLRYVLMIFLFLIGRGEVMHTSNSVTKQISLLNCILVMFLFSGAQTPVSAQTSPPPIYSPKPGSTLTSTTVTFAGVHISPDLQHSVTVGSSPGGTNFYEGQPVAFHNLRAGYTLFTVSGLPSSGTIYVRYETWTSGHPRLAKTHSYTMSVGRTDSKRLDSTNGDSNGCNSDRFTCIFPDTTYPNGAVVRDNETDLVWERSPIETPQASWTRAIAHCANREVSGRKGWSLPMREQLGALVDSLNSNPALPTGHPFELPTAQSAIWSATSDTGNPSRVWSMTVGTGGLDRSDKTSTNLHAWCLRGAQTYDGPGF